jgi:hypothetical protein
MNTEIKWMKVDGKWQKSDQKEIISTHSSSQVCYLNTESNNSLK